MIGVRATTSNRDKAIKIASPLKWHGGKSYLATKIVAMMPKHIHYVEPYAGGLSVLLAKDPEGISEVANDLNLDLTIFWRVLACEQSFPEFVRRMQATPFSEAEWNREPEGTVRHGTETTYIEAVETASRFFVRCRQSLAGRMKDFASLSRTRVRRGMNEQASAWLTTVEGLPEVHARLKRVVILNRDALDVIRQQDGPDTLYYLDPTYLHETRATTGEYSHEMSNEQHGNLLELLTSIKGKFLLSGYRSKRYDSTAAAAKWGRADFDLPNNSAGGKEKRRMTECLWMNFKT